ncbi:MAG: type II toxin-antitoxin system VapC family toxin [Candidatus Humimicrobiaceae bacterium]
MISYLDTSAIVKFYISETGSQKVREIFDLSDVLATSCIAYIETISAFTRINNEKKLSDSDYKNIVLNFKKDWEDLFVLKIDNTIIKTAGRFIESYLIKGYDSIHLASAVMLSKRINQIINFCCWDKKLNEAALKENMSIFGDDLNL